MKKIIFILATIVFYSLLSCSEDKIMTYHGEDYIFFSDRVENSGYDIWWDSLKTFNFFFTNANDTLISLSVSAGGKVYDYDRIFLVEPEVEGDGVEGLDFELAREQIMPAKRSKTSIYVKLKRRAEMEGKTFSVKVNLKPNENFTTNLPWGIDKNSDTVSRHVMTVMCQAELAPPAFYTSSMNLGLGYWSVLKFNTMNEVMGTTIDDWLNPDSKLRKNVNNHFIVFANYLNRKVAEGPDAAIKDPAKESTRGYMSISGFEYFGIMPTVIPADFPTTPEWEGNK